jgi:hypothetical protein
MEEGGKAATTAAVTVERRTVSSRVPISGSFRSLTVTSDATDRY